VAALLLFVSMTLTDAASVRAADPSPLASPAASPVLVDPLDPRAGEGASRVGAPAVALIVVVGIGIATAAATIAYVRLARRA
jgi:hypothetical protein